MNIRHCKAFQGSKTEKWHGDMINLRNHGAR